jgi:argininosuccinate lyase
MKAATAQGFLTATEVADALVHQGIPFAQAHEQVGKLVKYCVDRNKSFADVTEEEARRFIPAWNKSIAMVAVSPELSVQKKNVIGGTAPVQVARQLASADRRLARLKHDLGLAKAR